MSTKSIIFVLLIVILGVAAMVFNSGNQTVNVILACERPAHLVVETKLDLSGSIETEASKTALGSILSQKVRADFEKIDPNSWNALASTYQYQACQAINSLGCGELDASACRREKLETLQDVYNQITNDVREREERRIADQVAACSAKLVGEFEKPIEEHKITDGARARAPGIGGGRNTERERICASVGPNQEIVSARTEQHSCHGGRCSVTAPEISDDRKSVCVTATAWSESKSFGGGGSGQYKLFVTFKNLTTAEDLVRFEAQCRDEVK